MKSSPECWEPVEDYLVQQTRTEKRRGLEAGSPIPAREYASAHAHLRAGPFHLPDGGAGRKPPIGFEFLPSRKNLGWEESREPNYQVVLQTRHRDLWHRCPRQGGNPSSLPLPLGQWWSAPGHRLSLVCSGSEIEGSSQLRSKRLGREGREGAAL